MSLSTTLFYFSNGETDKEKHHSLNTTHLTPYLVLAVLLIPCSLVASFSYFSNHHTIEHHTFDTITCSCCSFFLICSSFVFSYLSSHHTIEHHTFDTISCSRCSSLSLVCSLLVFSYFSGFSLFFFLSMFLVLVSSLCPSVATPPPREHIYITATYLSPPIHTWPPFVTFVNRTPESLFSTSQEIRKEPSSFHLA